MGPDFFARWSTDELLSLRERCVRDANNDNLSLAAQRFCAQTADDLGVEIDRRLHEMAGKAS